jgi:hypothetical protein
MLNLGTAGLINRINYAANLIINSRIARRTEGQTERGLKDSNRGITLAIQVFDETSASADPFLMLLAEYTFTVQEPMSTT